MQQKVPVTKRRKEKLRRQRKLSLHQLRKRRCIGSEDARSRESPPPQSYKEEKASGDLEGYWKHPAPV
eukprot:1161064-Pelagomonas_calceolata.AAC.1